MERETMVDIALKEVWKMRGGKKLIAVRAGVDVSDVEQLIKANDERVVDAILSLTKMGGKIRTVDTECKKFTMKIIRSALWDRRLYAIFGPTGVGKTTSIEAAIGELNDPSIAYVRINAFNRNNKFELIRQITLGLNLGNPESSPAYKRRAGYAIFSKLTEQYTKRRGVVVIDEAQKLAEETYSVLRDCYDETALSFCYFGSPDFRRTLEARRLDTHPLGEFIGRFDDRYDLPHSSPKDVKLFLEAYSIEVDTRESKAIAQKISEWRDIGTLNNAMKIIVGDVHNGEMSWRKVGAGQILDAIERVRTMMKPDEDEEGDEKDKGSNAAKD